MEQKFDNNDLDVNVRTLKNGDEVLFYAKDVAKALGYKNTRNAIQKHVWDEDKRILGDLQKGPPEWHFLRGHPATVLINEQGLYQLIFASKLKTAREFRRLVFKDVLPSIRKTDTCTVTAGVPLVGRQIRLLNENDLHFKVVEYIRKYHPQTLIIEGLGEFQKTQELRREGWCKGYTAGQPDIIIANPSNGYV